MSWFEKLIPSRIGTSTRAKGNVPEGLWVKCAGCSTVLYRAELERTHEVCEKCGAHMRLFARARIKQLMDPDGQHELDTDVVPVDALKFKDSKRYKDRLVQATKSSGEKDALIVVRGSIEGVAVVVAVFDFRFMGGSMGSVVGEKFTRACEHCIENSLPLVCFSASGGARMQEALYSLLQMGKTSSKLAQLSDRGLPFISVLTDPTMGGVSASLAMLGDLIIAEPGARIGFAGPRVIEQTVREKLPEGFQSSEFLLEHGAIDMIVDRRDMRAKLSTLLAMLMKLEQPSKPQPSVADGEDDTDSKDESNASSQADESSPVIESDPGAQNQPAEAAQDASPDAADKAEKKAPSRKSKSTKADSAKTTKAAADNDSDAQASKEQSGNDAKPSDKPSKPADKPDTSS